MESTCLFCRIANGEIPVQRLFEDDDLIAFADIAPQAPVHLLIIPRQHHPHLFATGAPEAPLLGKMVATATELARQAGLDPGGFRLVMNCLSDGGQSVFHLHLHLLGGRPMEWPPG